MYLVLSFLVRLPYCIFQGVYRPLMASIGVTTHNIPLSACAAIVGFGLVGVFRIPP